MLEGGTKGVPETKGIYYTNEVLAVLGSRFPAKLAIYESGSSYGLADSFDGVRDRLLT